MLPLMDRRDAERARFVVSLFVDAMAPTTGAWADADLLGAAMADPDARAAARDYLAARTRPT